MEVLHPCAARPDVLQEQHLFYPLAFLKGAYVGYETLLSLLGFDEEEEVILEYYDVAYDDIVHRALPEDRTTIQIAGLGLARTGTTSLVLALEQLGYSAVHDDEQVELTDIDYYLEEDIIDGDEFHEILGERGYNATVKTANLKWVEKHPEVKAILTMRDTPESYVQSYLNAAYNHKVQATIPAERLLSFKVGDGWGPLCEFLGVPVPEDIPFPHVHTRAKL
ncbi:hypothetical protein ACHAWF_014261 [Thalassiosira exigua]